MRGDKEECRILGSLFLVYTVSGLRISALFRSSAKTLSASEGFVQQGRSLFDARSVQFVREHGKRARTPLAAFFNIPIRLP